MTVKEVIERLKTLDQEKGIWISFECGYDFIAPVPDSFADESDISMDASRRRGVNVGDYIINAW